MKEIGMLTRYFKRQTTLESYYGSSAGQYFDEFTDYLEKSGFHQEVICQYLPGVKMFAAWADAAYGRVASLPADTCSNYREYLAENGRLRYEKGEYSSSYRAAEHFLEFLASQNPIKCISIPPKTPRPELLSQFEAWMQAHRGLCSSTLNAYRNHIVDLLSTLGDQPAQFTAGALHSFIMSYARKHSHAPVKKRLTALRMFIRFLIATGLCPVGLDAAIPTIANWPLARLPRYISAEDVERVLASSNGATPIGLRDKAILLLLARLGLRASEVAEMVMSDIDWSAGTFTVIGKSRREAKLPLPQEVGDAVLHYLAGGRPTVTTDRVFITATAPWRPITRYVVKQVAGKAIQQAGITAPSFGAHVLRHSAATTMLRQGASLQVIGEVLRHSCLETTAHYAKVDIAMLREVARPWPGATSC